MDCYDTSLFIFRRDLRLADNTALNAALRSSKQVIAAFIFDDRQIAPHPYQSKPALHFMLQSLQDLQQQLHNIQAALTLCQGWPNEVIAQLHQQHCIQAVFINRDYTPFSRRRDHEIATTCQQLQIALHVLPDALLLEPEHALKANGSYYQVFTPFYNYARLQPVALPHALAEGKFLTITTGISLNTFASLDTFSSTTLAGGRTGALQQLAKLPNCKTYAETRDFPTLASTSHLSAHLKFGTVSVREVFYAIYQQLGETHPLLRQLYWRDFFTHIAYHVPKVFGHAFIEKYDAITWQNNWDYFQAWTEGKTGFPIVDAAMRDLNATGNMHNRLRMVVASFLVKDLHISWRWGERYFAQHLLDYDPCLNNGNWQWAASTGCDAQPYFRIFNPWLQQQKFDPDCDYIYHWLPELKAVPVKILHNWHTMHYGDFYPAPIVDHSAQSAAIKAQFKQLTG
jgi:deoxyribodipyrimidine photo-lyase